MQQKGETLHARQLGAAGRSMLTSSACDSVCISLAVRQTSFSPTTVQAQLDTTGTVFTTVHTAVLAKASGI